MTSYPARLLGFSLRDLSSEAHASNDYILIFTLSKEAFVIHIYFVLKFIFQNECSETCCAKKAFTTNTSYTTGSAIKKGIFFFSITLTKASINPK